MKLYCKMFRVYAILSTHIKWHRPKLSIYRIPPYSPELNMIEIVWRKIKYEWLPFSAYYLARIDY